MAENVDDIELEDLDRERQQVIEEEETSFIDDRGPGDASILIIDGSNPVFTRVDGDNVRGNNEEMRDADRDLGRGIGVKRRRAIHNMKQFLKEGLGITVNKGDGPNSTIIYDKVRFTTDKDNKINGVTYKGKKIKAKTEGKNNKALLYDAMRKAAELKADKIRLKLNQKPVSEEVLSMIEEETDVNDLTRLEKFKKWARENVVGVSAIAISIAGIVTTAVIGARSVVKKGRKALGKFAKGVSKVFKKLGPLFSALGTLISKMILAGSQGLLWLSQNLWVLFLIIASIVYNEYRRKRKRR